MKDSTIHILNSLKSFIASVENDILNFDKMEKVLLQKISKEKLIDCLTDDSLDVDDISSCKEMLKLYYNYETMIN